MIKAAIVMHDEATLQTENAARIRSTRVLQRFHIVPAASLVRQTVAGLMKAGRVSGPNTFAYGRETTNVRPKSLLLLRGLWSANGEPISLADACTIVYGRPATLRAMRQTSFRASRALDRVQCPLLVHSRSGWLFLWRRNTKMAARRYDRRTASKVQANV